MGVAVDAFLGRFGGRQLFEGDEVWGQGWFPAIGHDLYLIVGGPAAVPCIPGDGFVGHFTNVDRLPYDRSMDTYLEVISARIVG